MAAAAALGAALAARLAGGGGGGAAAAAAKGARAAATRCVGRTGACLRATRPPSAAPAAAVAAASTAGSSGTGGQGAGERGARGARGAAGSSGAPPPPPPEGGGGGEPGDGTRGGQKAEGEVEGEAGPERGRGSGDEEFVEMLKEHRGRGRVESYDLEELSGPLHWLGREVSRIWGWAGVRLVQARLETEWDHEDFLAGAEDAFRTLVPLLGDPEEDFEGMAPARIREVLTSTREDYAEAGMTMALEVEEVRDRFIVHVGLVQPDAVAWLEGADEGDRPDGTDGALPNPAEGLADAFQSGEDREGGDGAGDAEPWLAVHVRFEATVRTVLTDRDGVVVSDSRDARGQTWKFAKGPLPAALPVRIVDRPWQVIGID